MQIKNISMISPLIVVKAHSASLKHSFIFDFIHTIIQGVFPKSISWRKIFTLFYARNSRGRHAKPPLGFAPASKNLSNLVKNLANPAKA